MEQWYKDGEIYNSMTSIRNKMKDTSLPMLLTDSIVAELGFVKVVYGVKPTPTEVQYVVEDAITIIAGVPTQGYTLQDMFADTAEYTGMDGVIVPAKTKAEHEVEYLANKQADMMASIVQHFTDVTTSYIEAKVQAYNVANGLAFKDIDAFTKYAINPLSVHHAIANQFIDYADNVWTTVRTYQTTAVSIPTDTEFQVLLDSVIF
jgi:hypothetical protein